MPADQEPSDFLPRLPKRVKPTAWPPTAARKIPPLKRHDSEHHHVRQPRTHGVHSSLEEACSRLVSSWLDGTEMMIEPLHKDCQSKNERSRPRHTSQCLNQATLGKELLFYGPKRRCYASRCCAPSFCGGDASSLWRSRLMSEMKIRRCRGVASSHDLPFGIVWDG
ncbi:hypothetical protein OIU79_012727 [Salix purpurea]|uniref:Uncharacterized protein n=1 Tax=Salix purpurea TaxID=77065 RepID=A0A9Q0Q4C9_SALPP|nr:hypothetical protein OIU79_012727 [Salix purpurea]